VIVDEALCGHFERSPLFADSRGHERAPLAAITARSPEPAFPSQVVRFIVLTIRRPALDARSADRTRDQTEPRASNRVGRNHGNTQRRAPPPVARQPPALGDHNSREPPLASHFLFVLSALRSARRCSTRRRCGPVAGAKVVWSCSFRFVLLPLPALHHQHHHHQRRRQTKNSILFTCLIQALSVAATRRAPLPPGQGDGWPAWLTTCNERKGTP
jgi:hypothetical protein